MVYLMENKELGKQRFSTKILFAFANYMEEDADFHHLS